MGWRFLPQCEVTLVVCLDTTASMQRYFGAVKAHMDKCIKRLHELPTLAGSGDIEKFASVSVRVKILSYDDAAQIRSSAMYDAERDFDALMAYLDALEVTSESVAADTHTALEAAIREINAIPVPSPYGAEAKKGVLMLISNSPVSPKKSPIESKAMEKAWCENGLRIGMCRSRKALELCYGGDAEEIEDIAKYMGVTITRMTCSDDIDAVTDCIVRDLFWTD